MQGWKGFNTYLQAAHDGWDPVEEEYNDYSTAYTVEWEDDEKVYEDYEDDDDELIYDYSRLNMTDGQIDQIYAPVRDYSTLTALNDFVKGETNEDFDCIERYVLVSLMAVQDNAQMTLSFMVNRNGTIDESEDDDGESSNWDSGAVFGYQTGIKYASLLSFIALYNIVI